MEKEATNKCKRCKNLAASAKNELVDLTDEWKSLDELQQEQELEMQLTAAIESAMTKLVPAAIESAITKLVPHMLAATTVMQKMQQEKDIVPSEKKDSKDDED